MDAESGSNYNAEVTLKEFMEKHRNEEECLDTFAQIAVAFRELHASGILNYYIKAENFLMKPMEGGKPIIKVVGFE